MSFKGPCFHPHYLSAGVWMHCYAGFLIQQLSFSVLFDINLFSLLKLVISAAGYLSVFRETQHSLDIMLTAASGQATVLTIDQAIALLMRSVFESCDFLDLTVIKMYGV